MVSFLENTFSVKSFLCMGQSRQGCLNCAYCRADFTKNNHMKFYTPPADINPIFATVPVVVNIFYGDPLIQINNTLCALMALEGSNHTGPVVLITKAHLNSYIAERLKRFNLDLHICLSTFGKHHKVDGGSPIFFERSLDNAAKAGLKFSVEFRPIMHGINDDEETISYVMSKAGEYKVPVGYSALQAGPGVLESIRAVGVEPQPFPGKNFHNRLKPMDTATDDKIRMIANAHGVNVFRKTSCLLSYQHGMERDFNAHYYRVNDVSCVDCVMAGKCANFKNNMGQDTIDLAKKVLPFEHEVIYKKHHTCSIVKTCESATPACHNIDGYFLYPKEEIYRPDARMVKWLTGFMVDADIKDGDHLSDFWAVD